ncbi:TPA: hypothetical protein DEP21_01955 [Patescibacteria group bacterium]|nr:hypothetical protein [Candidatus Gracilibacteria bacterium]
MNISSYDLFYGKNKSYLNTRKPLCLTISTDYYDRMTDRNMASMMDMTACFMVRNAAGKLGIYCVQKTIRIWTISPSRCSLDQV